MDKKLILSADTPCDIGPELKARYGVSLFPLHIVLDNQQYTDGNDISPDDIYAAWWEHKVLPRTAAINPDEYVSYFRQFTDVGCEVLHISLGSGLSSSYQNAKLAATELPGVHVIDSCSLSTGFGLLVCETGDRIQKSMPVEQIVEEIQAIVPKTSASFVLDTLEFMHAGGRCSGAVHLTANLMQIKPSIIVRNDRCGSMTVGKKYMGHLDRAIKKYIEDTIGGRNDIVLDRAFITHSGISSTLLESACKTVNALQPFKELHVTRASCTISSHCGPNTLGVLFIQK